MTRQRLIETILEGMGYSPEGIVAMTATGIERNTDVTDAINIADLLTERGIVKLDADK